MRRWISPWVQVCRSVPALLGWGVFLAAVLFTANVESDEIALAAAVVVSYVLGSGVLGGPSIRPRRYLLGRVVMGAVASLWGGFAVVERGVSVPGLAGAGLLAVGIWLLLDVLAVALTRSAHSLSLWDSDPVEQVRLQPIEATLRRASRPMTITDIVDRCDCPEETVRRGLSVLLIAGRVAPRDHGFVRRNVLLGRDFSPRDLLARFGRPLATFGLGPSRQA